MRHPAMEYVQVGAVLSGQDDRNFYSFIHGKAAACFEDFFSPDEVERIVSSFYEARSDWSSYFGGHNQSLGEAWFPYHEENINFDVYTQKAKQSRALVEKYIPGLEARVIQFAQAIAKDVPVVIRPGWAGPGLMAQIANSHVARIGGEIHCDVDSMTDEELKNPDLQILSFVGMLQKPLKGGNLTLWNHPYDAASPREQTYEMDPKSVQSAYLTYRSGDLWMFNGFSPHLVEPFEGDKDRVCLVFHIIRSTDSWHLWF